jgi:(1->4)-alpha-D-glucan 1-alpha-D-glucosylmutase
VDDFHHENLRRLESWPFSLLASSTHDTKRSEDVRARINVLSEMPQLWSQEVMRWRRSNRARKSVISDGRSVPDLNEEYLLYQTLVGTWPREMPDGPAREQYIGRIQQYMHKAVHEAKVNLSWINPNPEYMAGLETFIASILTPGAQGRHNRFLEDLQKFAPTVAFFGMMNSLSQTLLKITSPGVPDIYQGNEIWDFSLVDPDNRRPVDFELRQRMQAELKVAGASGDLAQLCDELVRNCHDGRIKLWATMRALCVRRQRAELFQSGSYIPLTATGAKPEHLCGFARTRGAETVIVAVPRLVYKLAGGELRAPIGDLWQNTQITIGPSAPGEFENVFTGERLQPGNAQSLLCRELFAHFPMALLVSR